MASVTTRTKRRFLRKAFRTATVNGSTLLAELESLDDAQFQRTKDGPVLTGTSANGHSYSWTLDPNLSAHDIADMLEELLTRYEEAVEYLADEEDIESPTNTQVYNEMMRCLTAVRSFANDFTYGRCERSDDSE